MKFREKNWNYQKKYPPGLDLKELFDPHPLPEYYNFWLIVLARRMNECAFEM